MKKDHQEKIKLARKLRTPEELRAGTPIFETKAWTKRKKAIKQRVKQREAGQKEVSRLAKLRKKKKDGHS